MLRREPAPPQSQAETRAAGPRPPPTQSPSQPAPEQRPAAAQAGGTRLALGKAAAIKTELDLRGLTAAEALEELDKYLDDALLAGLSTARIIHGKGTGALREAVSSECLLPDSLPAGQELAD